MSVVAISTYITNRLPKKAPPGGGGGGGGGRRLNPAGAGTGPYVAVDVFSYYM